MLRVYNIKYAWHGRDPNIQGPGTPPVAREQDVELRHHCRLCRKRQSLQVCMCVCVRVCVGVGVGVRAFVCGPEQLGVWVGAGA